MVRVPYNYIPLHGSHHPVQDHFRHIGATNQHETIKTFIHLRRRPGHDPIPHFDEFIGCPPRQRIADGAFIAKWGAHEEDLDKVIQFCREHNVEVIHSSQASRQVEVEGTIAQFNNMFAVEIHDYEKEHINLGTVRFRSHGEIHLPEHIHPTVLGVFGLSDEPIYVSAVKNVPLPPGQELPPHTVTNLISEIKDVYNVPTNSGAGQTVAIFSPSNAGHTLHNDLVLSCNYYGIPVPKLTNIIIDGTVPGEGLGTDTAGEVTLDIAMVAAFGQGADIAVYFTNISMQVFISRVVHPILGDPICSALSISFVTGTDKGAPASELSSFTTVLEDAAILGVTCCFPTGDVGAANDVSYQSPGVPRIGLPSSNPWGLAIGGTILGTTSGTLSNSNYLEWVWNQATTANPNRAGGTGGGVSESYPRPSYQDVANIPASIATGFAGRGTPDVSGNANGFPLYYQGKFAPTGGVSATTPMHAAIFAVINQALGRNVGFINPTIYKMQNGIYNASAINSVGQTFTDSDGNIWGLANSTSQGNQITVNGSVDAPTSNVVYILFYQPSHTYWQCNTAGNWYSKTSVSGVWTGPVTNPLTNICCIRDIDGSTGGPQDNGGQGGAEGYPVGKGWDGCTGWGAINGVAFLNFLKAYGTIPAANEVFIQVKAVNSIGESASSSAFGPFIADANPVGSIVPESVSGSVTAVSNGVNQLTISWKAASYGTPPITYDIYATKTPSGPYIKMANTSALTITVTFTTATLLPGSSVYILVDSLNGAGYGSGGGFFSGPFTVRTS